MTNLTPLVEQKDTYIAIYPQDHLEEDSPEEDFPEEDFREGDPPEEDPPEEDPQEEEDPSEGDNPWECQDNNKRQTNS